MLSTSSTVVRILGIQQQQRAEPSSERHQARFRAARFFRPLAFTAFAGASEASDCSGVSSSPVDPGVSGRSSAMLSCSVAGDEPCMRSRAAAIPQRANDTAQVREMEGGVACESSSCVKWPSSSTCPGQCRSIIANVETDSTSEGGRRKGNRKCD